MPRTQRFTLACLIWITACGGDDLTPVPHQPLIEEETFPDIYASPTWHAYGTIAMEGVGNQTFEVGNTGTDVLMINTLTISGTDAAAFSIIDDEVSDATIPPEGNALAVSISFAPVRAGTQAAILEIPSNDPDENPLELELHGVGVLTGDAPVAVCNVEPESVYVPGQTAEWIGSGSYDPAGLTLVGFAWRLSSKPTDSNAFMPSCSHLPDCGPFVADVPGNYVAELTVQNEIGLTNSCTVSLEATVGGGPVAVCDVHPRVVHPPFESATWLGSGSHDPNGFVVVSHTWQLTSTPSGSATTMPSCSTPDCGPFTPDVAGIYTAKLTVENELGHTDSCTATLEAVPAEELWVEMFWEHSGDDMDLHLLAPGGTPRSSTDCYFANCVGGGFLDWGQSGFGGDDPALDLDDIPGTGPENINVSSPSTGTYGVFVHDYPMSSYTPGNNVTVNVYVNGNPVYSDTRTIVGEDSDEYFCQIEWPSGVVTPL
ncbi:hypothetical protein ACFL6C_00325 [Myxococcota bacterium]